MAQPHGRRLVALTRLGIPPPAPRILSLIVPWGRRGAHRVRAFSREAPPLRFPRASRLRVAGDSPTQVTGGSHAFDSELATSQNRRASVFVTDYVVTGHPGRRCLLVKLFNAE